MARRGPAVPHQVHAPRLVRLHALVLHLARYANIDLGWIQEQVRVDPEVLLRAPRDGKRLAEVGEVHRPARCLICRALPAHQHRTRRDGRNRHSAHPCVPGGVVHRHDDQPVSSREPQVVDARLALALPVIPVALRVPAPLRDQALLPDPLRPPLRGSETQSRVLRVQAAARPSAELVRPLAVRIPRVPRHRHAEARDSPIWRAMHPRTSARRAGVATSATARARRSRGSGAKR